MTFCNGLSRGCVYVRLAVAARLGLKFEKVLVDSRRLLFQVASYRPPPHLTRRLTPTS